MMHRNIRTCLLGTAFAGGLLVLGNVAANAADGGPGGAGVDTGKLAVGLLFLAFGVLLALFLRRKRP
ncbi:hypothetical protein [Arthrobacter sp. MAHUQ-56]